MKRVRLPRTAGPTAGTAAGTTPGTTAGTAASTAASTAPDRAPHLPPRMGRSAPNRSLERGLEILRAFRPGLEALGNGELAERTGLPRATVSRLAQTLVDAGWLDHDAATRTYHPAATSLSLAFAMRSGSAVLAAAAPAMREASARLRANVGLAVADRDEMVYLESIRYDRRPALRTIVAGQRIPMELTSLGHAWLAALPAPRRHALLAVFRHRRDPAAWRPIGRAIEVARHDIASRGFCVACWQPGVVALAAPLVVGERLVAALNLTVGDGEPTSVVLARLAAPYLELHRTIVERLHQDRPG